MDLIVKQKVALLKTASISIPWIISILILDTVLFRAILGQGLFTLFFLEKSRYTALICQV